MKRNTWFNLLMILGLVLALGGSDSLTRWASAQAPGPEGQSSIQAAEGDAFTYQGRLLKSDVPVDDTCDFQFSLWDADSGGSQVGSTQTASGVGVNDGYFSVPLDFGSSAFQGDARYLQIAARCPAGSDSYTTLSGRVALTAAPYAHSLRPGAKVSSNATSGSVLQAVSSATSGGPAGLYGEANSSSGAGVAGWNLANSGGYGVYGLNTSGLGVPYGVYGSASNAGSAISFGVYGDSNSSVGTGVGGEAPKNGVYGKATASSGYGVYGEATASSGVNYGVYGKTSSPDGYGVYGQNFNSSSGYGVYGRGFRGVEGYSDSLNGAGGFFRNMSATASENSVGMWAGSYYGDIIQGHELDTDGTSMNRRFRVTYQGDVYIDGTYYNTGADFAEMLPAVEGLEPGDVLVVGPDGQLARSSEAYQPTVVGVYSTKPGFLGGAEDGADLTDKAPLAIVGIVPVKVSDENGPIAPGDLLVASSIPGHAMQAGLHPSIGTVIGKALAGLESGVGVIQLLVTLQ